MTSTAQSTLTGYLRRLAAHLENGPDSASDSAIGARAQYRAAITRASPRNRGDGGGLAVGSSVWRPRSSGGYSLTADTW